MEATIQNRSQAARIACVSNSTDPDVLVRGALFATELEDYATRAADEIARAVVLVMDRGPDYGILDGARAAFDVMKNVAAGASGMKETAMRKLGVEGQKRGMTAEQMITAWLAAHGAH
jgi:hypothetical protein